MKQLLILIGAIFLLSPDAPAATKLQRKCARDNHSEVCRAYVDGVIEGYIISKQKYVSRPPKFESDFLNRVYDVRVGKQRVDFKRGKRACLPENIDINEIIAQLKNRVHKQTLTDELSNYLSEKYPCK